ncbi:MAG: hypothetical protein WCW30_03520 [Candidatus Gracilibacteria bacterium]
MDLKLLASLTSVLRRTLLTMIDSTGFGYVSPSVAYLDVLTALYFGEDHGRPVLQYDPTKPQWEGRDAVVLSSEEAMPAWFVCLRQAGFRVGEKLNEPLTVKIPGVDAPIGSSGQGLAIGVGMAQAFLSDKKTNRVFLIVGDMDIYHGEFWEAAMRAGYERLERLIVICAHTGDAKIQPLEAKFEACRFKVIKIMDGHEGAQLVDAIARAKETSRQPTVILAPVILGKGIPFAEGKDLYRRAAFSKEEMAIALGQSMKSY